MHEASEQQAEKLLSEALDMFRCSKDADIKSDNRTRIEVERAFSLAKRNHGLGLLNTKLDTTTRSPIALFIIAMNVEQLSRTFLHLFSEQISWRIKQWFTVLSDKYNKPLANW